MRILVTAGPTREAIDCVRFISNRSTGKMGYAIAEAAVARGHEAHLVSGPVSLALPRGVALTNVQSAEEMLAAVEQQLPWCDVLIMAAAVADWRPGRPETGKLKKASGVPALELVRTPDILEHIAPAKESRCFVGFAAEAGDPLTEAKRKLEEKGLDLVVGNDISRPDSGFEADTNKVVFVTRSGSIELPLLSKGVVAQRILDRVEELHSGVQH